MSWDKNLFSRGQVWAGPKPERQTRHHVFSGVKCKAHGRGADSSKLLASNAPSCSLTIRSCVLERVKVKGSRLGIMGPQVSASERCVHGSSKKRKAGKMYKVSSPRWIVYTAVYARSSETQGCKLQNIRKVFRFWTKKPANKSKWREYLEHSQQNGNCSGIPSVSLVCTGSWHVSPDIIERFVHHWRLQSEML